MKLRTFIKPFKELVYIQFFNNMKTPRIFMMFFIFI